MGEEAEYKGNEQVRWRDNNHRDSATAIFMRWVDEGSECVVGDQQSLCFLAEAKNVPLHALDTKQPNIPSITLQNELDNCISLPLTSFFQSSEPNITFEMSWLPWSGSSAPNTAASDGGRIAPNRTSRTHCYEGRDLFFSCLDRNNILDAIKDDKEARRKCGKEVADFEAACSQAWVCFFPSFYKNLSICPFLEKGLSTYVLFCWFYLILAMEIDADSAASIQVKYFKEKRVMEYNRDKTIERIQKEDAKKVQELKSQGWSPK